jgi:hypothetical protein
MDNRSTPEMRYVRLQIKFLAQEAYRLEIQMMVTMRLLQIRFTIWKAFLIRWIKGSNNMSRP